MGNNQDPHVIKKKQADGQYEDRTATIDQIGDFDIEKSNTEALKAVKRQ